MICLTPVTDVNYNNDGASAPALAWFGDMEFSNLDMAGVKADAVVMDINGFLDEQHYTRNIMFKDNSLPQQAIIKIKIAMH